VYLDSTISLEQLLSAIGGGQPPEMQLKPAALSASSPLSAPDVKKKSDPLLTPPSIAPAPIADRRNEPATATPAPTVIANTVEETNDHEYESHPCKNPGIAERFEDCTPGSNAGVQSRWSAFVESFMHDRPNIGTFLSLATVSGATESSIDLTYAAHFKFQFAEMTKKQNREEINRLLKSFMGRPIDVHITLETKKAEKEAQNYIKSVPHARAIESEIEREPIIQSVLDIFDGEILK
jgi:hypothetical protein